MTTAEQFRDAVAHPASEIVVAGVPWPAYKVVALVIGLVVFGVVAVATASASPAVLGGAGVAFVLWHVLGLLQRQR
ncbi:hypothetical protein BVC93_28070 [Mycobacterium sp. MS1601]|uniref:hypothetical protein n=1 Tax=Mycobacterium sp. MS1601 TaxID=1936029 RepID=UPI0009791F0C|nr:hypothetical protein [Mycobacterium sp. MS1601]AQA05592.1 hypothetical protein BVC93_28070 [Mycobacterium sp. MS1601]